MARVELFSFEPPHVWTGTDLASIGTKTHPPTRTSVSTDTSAPAVKPTWLHRAFGPSAAKIAAETAAAAAVAEAAAAFAAANPPRTFAELCAAYDANFRVTQGAPSRAVPLLAPDGTVREHKTVGEILMTLRGWVTSGRATGGDRVPCISGIDFFNPSGLMPYFPLLLSERLPHCMWAVMNIAATEEEVVAATARLTSV